MRETKKQKKKEKKKKTAKNKTHLAFTFIFITVCYIYYIVRKKVTKGDRHKKECNFAPIAKREMCARNLS